MIRNSRMREWLLVKDINALLLLSLFLLVFPSGCSSNKKPEYIPGSNIKGYRASISKVLLSPIAYDGATLALEGFVKELSQNKDGSSATVFNLSDLNGNTIRVLTPGEWNMKDNNYVIVGGIYRKKGNRFEARQFEKIVFIEKEKDKKIRKRNEW